MAKFTTRVELHDAKTPEDYTKLHSEMTKLGFSRSIILPNGQKVALPTAEYNIEGAFTIVDVKEKAKKAAALVKANFMVLVTEAANRDGYNLPAESPFIPFSGGVFGRR